MCANTLFLRLEGPLQAWGDQQSKFVIRRTAEAPTKSGVIGLLCAALGVNRSQATEKWLNKLNALRMGVRIDVPGVRWWDYHTVGAGMEMRTAEGKTKPGAMLMRREYLCDASFLVALQGDPDLIVRLSDALNNPHWTIYLGRKSCPPSRPVSENAPGVFPDLRAALKSIPWRKRCKEDTTPAKLDCLIEWRATPEQPIAPEDASIWFDMPVAFEPPSHVARFLILHELILGRNGDMQIADNPAQSHVSTPLRPRADYRNSAYRNARKARLKADDNLCVFCKSPATTVQHITYRRAGGDETHEDLRSLCRLCHDAVTMIEYGLGMGLDRINPEDPRWRDRIIAKRGEIIAFRSLETRRRRLQPEEVE